MKKLLITLLSLVMVMSFSSIAFAEDVADPVLGSWDGTDYTAYNSDGTINTDTNAHGDSFDVTADITKGDGTKDDTPVYCVDIAWTMTPAALAGEGDTYIWDPSTLKYVKDETRLGSTLSQASTANDDAEVSITVTNKSNAIVKYAIEYESKKNSGTNISTATQTTTGKESGTLESAAKDVTPTLAGSPEDTVSTGTATSETYTAKVELAKNGEDYVASCSDTELVMGTYTVSIKKCVKYNVQFKATGSSVKKMTNALYYIDNDNQVQSLTDYEDSNDWYNKEIDGEYLIFNVDSAGPHSLGSITGTGFTTLKYNDLDDNIQVLVDTIDTNNYVFNSDDDWNWYGDGATLFVMKLSGDAQITASGYWDD